MTLIAGFKAYSYPILIGDFVLSVQDQRVGLKKKILRIAPNCSVAWTGRGSAAEQIFRVLRKQFTGGRIGKDELEKTLTAFKETDFEPFFVRLIGWLITEEHLCFSWRTDWPSQVFYGDPMYAGSGGSVIERFAGPREMHDAENPNLTDLELAIDSCLSFTTHQMRLEMSADREQLTFGHAYEILYFADSEFHYVDDILYFGLTVQVDEYGKIASTEFDNVVHKYRVFGEYSVTERHEQGIGTQVHVIEPPGADGKGEAEQLASSLSANYQFSMASQFYCVFLRFLSPDYASPPIAIVQRANVPDEKRLIYVDDEGALLFKAHEPFLKWMYDTIKADST